VFCVKAILRKKRWLKAYTPPRQRSGVAPFCQNRFSACRKLASPRLYPLGGAGTPHLVEVQSDLMSPTPPQKVGPYEIIGPLGSGGMGQVFRARDPRLNREVAVKILPPEYSADPMRKLRFEQEARAIAALNHPGIVSIYDVGDGWMVTELVEGQTLRKAELTTLQVIDVGAQIAEALAAAHETGISHRDLKPENVLLTPDGRTKILDFGLAKIVTPASANEDPEDRSTLTNPGSPTGTPGYMSPEQVRGQESDYRSDIFSLGAVLYELLAGHPAFQAESAVEVMHAIVTADPDELPEQVPDGLRRIVKRCMEKKPAQRFQSARDLSFALRSFGVLNASARNTTDTASPAASARHGWLWPAVAAACLIAAAAFAMFRAGSSTPLDLSSYRFQPFSFSEDQEFSGVWSPDGESVAFVEQSSQGPNQGTHLMVQSLDTPAPTQLAATASQAPPVWSSDGTRIYFLGANGVFAVSRAGGQPERVINNASAFHISRDGRNLALWRPSRTDDGAGQHYSVWVSSPPGAPPVEYAQGPSVRTPFAPVFMRFSPDGKLLYLSMYTDAGAELWLLPFPPGSGKPRRIFQKVPWNRPPAASWMPDNQRLVLAGNPAPASGATLWLADTRNESLSRLLADPDGGQTTPSVSPDGKRLLFTKVAGDRDIVELPLDGTEPRTLLATSLPEFAPAWSPAGDQFAYVTRRNGTDELWVRSKEGNWDRPVVTAREFPTLEALVSPVFSPDGSRIAYTAVLAGGGGRRRSLAISPAGGGTPTIVADGYAPSWSPDGTKIAFLWVKPDGSTPIAIVALGSDKPPVEIPVIPGSAPEWSPSGQWIAVPTFMGITLASPNGKDMRMLPSLNSQALAWSKDSKTIYGLAYNSDPPALKALDVATGAVRTLAEYHIRFQPLQLIETSYTGSLRISLAPDGKSVAVGTATSQADLWILDGALK
jgi:eukaryotic-like serine/threonine-protein kinase